MSGRQRRKGRHPVENTYDKELPSSPAKQTIAAPPTVAR